MPKKYFLWITLDGAGIPLADRLRQEGHNVVVFIAHEKCKHLWDGMIPKVDNLNFLARDSERETYIVLDHVGLIKPQLRLRKLVRTMGELGDHLRELGFKVFGTSIFAEKLEMDREFAKEVCQLVNIPIPRTLKFNSLKEALSLIAQHKKRWVFKPNNNLAATFVSQEPDSSDLVEHINTLIEDKGSPNNIEGVLEEYIDGLEVSIEAWYQYGQIVPGSLNITLETKVAFAGQTGPAVGCSTSAVCGVKGNSRLFLETLAKLAGVFQRFQVTAPVDINTITPAKDASPVFLEFCGGRFGYSAIFEFMELLENDLGQLLADILDKKQVTIKLKSGFGYGMRVWHPPAPWHSDDESVQSAVMKDIEGTKIFISKRAQKEIHRHIWWQDVKKVEKFGKEMLVLAGTDGVIAEITAYGSTIPKAAATAEYYYKFLHTEHNDHYARIDKAQNQLYRWGVLMSWGLLKPLQTSKSPQTQPRQPQDKSLSAS